MIKNTLKYFLYLLILITIGVIYLSYFGIETKRFNQLIRDKVSDTAKGIDIELQTVKIVLDLRNLSIGLKTFDSDIIFKDKKVKLEKIGTNFSIRSFFKKEFTIKNASISTKENNLKDIIGLARIYQNTPQLFIFNKIVKNYKILFSFIML